MSGSTSSSSIWSMSGSGSRTTDDSSSRLAGPLKAGYAMLDAHPTVIDRKTG
jgi:hypothetical protein